ncbi:MAG: TauD/TfdA family dioxygenase [Pseudomonadales bacterium]|nr:TauD/TfdA family dioxygenase [Pseudomonadales bacterium]MBO6564038.1 TauD/TfdA family dioxygenase [Pseudomonadales bacterium]MBO6597435.1 TauD/TfdA family dioxygenase [Pseudomonadales bacterium]MBO6658065.1 TauD/TfdA family dioxygenase [Pseudomonadales bacterium]MBO6824169.1 TauD/TfdA family dioxygenase [Pseudomonadales bacterium]
MSFEIATITPGMGAEVRGLNIAEPLDDATVQALRDAWLKHMVLVFRDQELTRAEHKRFGRYFGELHIHPSFKSGMNKTGDPEIFVIDTPLDAKQSNGEAWHSDASCEEIPPMASLLYVTKVPENGGGDTMFANMYEAYAELSEDLKSLLQNKFAYHDGEIDLRSYGIRLRAGQNYPKASHPVVVHHPETGKPLLFVNGSFTSHVEGIPRWESDMLLDGLYEFVARNPRIQCRVKWSPGTLVMWDNRCVQHQAVRDYAGFARYGERVSVLDVARPV